MDVDGRKHALGVWIETTEGAKFWAKVLADLRNRGLRDILICCCDGLTGLPDAIRSVFPDTVVQTCTVHVIRSAMRFVSYQDRKKVAVSMRAIYTAPTLDAADLALKEFNTRWGRQYPAAIKVWENAWAEFIPFLDYDVEIRRIICSTNAIVILSPLLGVFDVCDGVVGSPGLGAGRGYLRLSSTRVSGRFDVCSAGGDAVVAA